MQMRQPAKPKMSFAPRMMAMRSTSASRCLPGVLALALCGCATPILDPVSVKPVPGYLLSPLSEPDCRAVADADGNVLPKAMGASAACFSAAEVRARTRLTGLQRAVRARERAIQSAIAAKKG